MEDKLKDITTDQLINELQQRGYFTDLLWCRADVDKQLEHINDGRKEPIVLEDGEKDIVLSEAINTDVYCERINNDIYDDLYNTYIRAFSM